MAYDGTYWPVNNYSFMKRLSVLLNSFLFTRLTFFWRCAEDNFQGFLDLFRNWRWSWNGVSLDKKSHYNASESDFKLTD